MANEGMYNIRKIFVPFSKGQQLDYAIISANNMTLRV